MEYYLVITKNCNLRCSYCFRKKVHQQISYDRAQPQPAASVVDFIRADLERYPSSGSSLVFSGGEPLLNQAYMQKILNGLEDYPLDRVLITNGTLLHTLERDLLYQLDYILVSIDGDQTQHDRLRGGGTYRRILDNLAQIRRAFPGKTIARLTLSPHADIEKSVLDIIDAFDAVHWQLVNQRENGNSQQFLDCYEEGLDRLRAYWLAHLKSGVVKRIIPFQAVASSLCLGIHYETLRCGSSGDELYIIDLDGQIYTCDELVGDPRFRVGDIQQGVPRQVRFPSYSLNETCRGCQIRQVCGGRCLHTSLLYPPDRFQFYCQATRLLVSKVEEILPWIRALLDSGRIKPSELNDPAIYQTEAIP
ncbi:MAG: radical SAM protein [Candidatus Tectomicrobia bacterium]|uniref:Radical SAM protein n=1 Tax=Tectimicrobiota bacterium TaxID=2528274 RepID=A0A932FVM2_UNCTE|nr:radical SAM protein [Candidatus Tectomicrobia bacterium]